MTRPKVSVITCSYNRPALLERAIRSLREQTDQDWEHLIYDDASSDPNVKRVLAWAKQDPRVRIWLGQENLDRPSVLWNFMMDRAYGRYLTVLDDDNEKLPTFVEVMSRELDQDPTLDLVTCGWRVDRAEGPLESEYYLNLSSSAERLRTLSTCDGGAMLYRRETFERAGYFSEELRTNEDWDWLRRAVHTGTIKNLHEVHSTYRSHNDSRMKRADALGNVDDILRVKARPLASGLGVRFTYPDPTRLTQSQKDVCSSLANARASIPWLSPGNDLAVVISPFQQSNVEVARAVEHASRALSIHMEDPYALETNLERVRLMASTLETWVCTNDAATVPYYRKLVGDQVIVCPTLGADDSIVSSVFTARECPRDIDILICGYAYPSRSRFISALLPHIKNFQIHIVGDGWGQIDNLSMSPTQGLQATYGLHARARAVVCLHRVHGDCSDGPVEPVTLNRGFMEGYSGARVFIDRSRPLHAFDEGDVVFYDSVGDLAMKLKAFLGMPNAAQANGLQEKCRRVYTYRARLARIINCVRAPRYLAEIP